MAGTSKLFGNPSGIPWIANQVDTTIADDIGGICAIKVAASTLAYGDLVYQLPGGRVDKSLESSLYPAFFAGVVVGGQTTGQAASSDSSLIGTTMSTVGQNVIIMTHGNCYAAADVTTQIRAGDPIVAGTTTAGRALGGATSSYAPLTAGLAIKAGASALAKSVNAFTGIYSGIAGTATAANLDTAALSGTITNAKFNLYAFRVATNGTSVTSAMGTEGATLSAVIWPTAGASNLVTYGFVVINPTGTGNFVGGTTALDDATVVPNAKYYNLVGRHTTLGIAMTTPAAGAGAAFVIRIRG
jgi:hypothetical protein